MSSRARRTTCSVGIAAAITMLAAAPASAGPPTGSYEIVARQNTRYVHLTTGNLLPPNTYVDDRTFILSTSSPGAARMPFPVKIYGETRNTMTVSTNGNIQFNSSVSGEYVNDCLPTGVLRGRVVAPYWDDLVFDTGAGEGIFTATRGRAPRRTYIVAWQGRRYATAAVVRAEVMFFENSRNIRMQYGAGNGASATIGVQLKTNPPPQNRSVQWSCNQPGSVRPGQRLTFVHHF